MGIWFYLCFDFFSPVPKARENPQSVQFCEKLGIDNPFHPTGKLNLNFFYVLTTTKKKNFLKILLHYHS